MAASRALGALLPLAERRRRREPPNCSHTRSAGQRPELAKLGASGALLSVIPVQNEDEPPGCCPAARKSSTRSAVRVSAHIVPNAQAHDAEPLNDGDSVLGCGEAAPTLVKEQKESPEEAETATNGCVKPSSRWLLDRSTGAMYRPGCSKWACNICSKAHMPACRIALAESMTTLAKKGVLWTMIATWEGDQEPTAEEWRESTRRFLQAIQRGIRVDDDADAKNVPSVERGRRFVCAPHGYVAVMERGEKGRRAHLHVVFAGPARLPFKALHKAAEQAGLGRYLGCEKVRDKARMATYLAFGSRKKPGGALSSYLSKEPGAVLEGAKRQQPVRISRAKGLMSLTAARLIVKADRASWRESKGWPLADWVPMTAAPVYVPKHAEMQGPEPGDFAGVAQPCAA